MSAFVTTDNLVKHYALPRDTLFGPRAVVRALDGVSLAIAAGTSFGVVGESGSGKSTLARLVMALEAPTAGRVTIAGDDVAALPAARLRALRPTFQMVFQDPYGSLDPRHRVGRIVAEPLHASPAADRASRVADALRAVGLSPDDAQKYPHEFSGGQRQRIAIARALVTRPRLVVADEPVSALDVSIRAQVLNLLKDLREALGLTLLLISHDLAVVDYVCDRVAVMYQGRIVEQGLAATILHRPAHPYTRALQEAVPRLEPGRRRHKGGPGGVRPVEAHGIVAPDRSRAVARGGCAFADRCPRVEARCRIEAPVLREVAADQQAACHVL